jgi:hypothetical protein
MLLNEKEIPIPIISGHKELLGYISNDVNNSLTSDEIPVRFVITKTDNDNYHCELGVLSDIDESYVSQMDSIFDFHKRSFENVEKFNVVLLIPTGIGAELGGHSGDGGPVARLFSAICDNLITHPNVVNAADINELPENALYVEGSIITRLLMGTVGLQKVRSNRVLLLIDKHHDKLFHEAAINSASAARAAFGLDCPLVIKMDDKILMRSLYSKSGRAVGRIEFIEKILTVLEKYKSQYDAVALSSLIEVPGHFHEDYFNDTMAGMVNPWGGVEAMLTHTISSLMDIPSAHSPMMNSKEVLNLDVGVVDPRKSAEAVSTTYLHCVLKGLHKSPQIMKYPFEKNNSELLTISDISCLVIPYGCIGLPTLAALEQGIPVIAVKENKNRMENKIEELPFTSGKLFIVNNYLEAAGLLGAIRAGIAPETLRRPLSYTTVHDMGFFSS